MELEVIVNATKLKPALLTPPPSKSDATRALTLAWMTGLPQPKLHAWPTDVTRLAGGLERLGTDQPIDCGDGAAPFRILLALAASMPGRSVFTGTQRLAERPHGPLFEALGLEPGGWPLAVQGREPRARYTVACELSSQYASALTLAACHAVLVAGRPCEVELVGAVASRGYLDVTLRWAQRAGFELETTPQLIRVLRHTAVHSLPPVPADWSSMGYLLLLALASGGVVDARGAGEHPDRAVLDHLEIAETDGLIEVKRARPQIDADLSGTPDLGPTLAALALAGGGGVLHNVEILRHKESDRLDAITALAYAVGAKTELRGSTLELGKASPTTSFRYGCRGDHRLTLAAISLACLLRCSAVLDRTEGVDKSFPGFFEQASRAGVSFE
ncbi:MAG: 3-phosphoshikimate 1-carboxyvinyltransferase [Myxococcaceae bacterium]|nr:3-phosphoshikimate 1-carboxyvinyltransferase [Myxococcaceae bacterium]